MTSISDSEPGLTRDAFLGGRVMATQPRDGFRSGVDAVLLAAAVPAKPRETVLELGCGAGVAGLCLLARVPDARVTGVEVQPDYADLARENGVPEVVTADLTALPPDLRQRQFHHVMMNPPYFDRGASLPAADAGRDLARGGAVGLERWIEVGAKRLRPRGTLTVIMHADRLSDLIAALHGRLGSLVIQPLAPRIGRDASLIIAQGIHLGRAPARLRAPLVLHDGARHERDGEDYSEAALTLLRDGAELDLRD